MHKRIKIILFIYIFIQNIYKSMCKLLHISYVILLKIHIIYIVLTYNRIAFCEINTFFCQILLNIESLEK